MMKRQTGFTLAEVLITLGIIGVVAAMTIPTLMSNTGKSEFKTAFKKVVSAVNQAVTMSVAVDYLDFGDAYAGDTTTESILSIISKKMQIAKTESSGVDDVKRMFKDSGATNYTIFFADGMVLSYPQTAAKCSNYKAPSAATECAAIIDVNGTKNPNKLSNCQTDITTGTNAEVDNDKGVTDINGSYCKEDNAFISDQYSVRFKGQQLIPNGYAARYVLYEK